MVTKANTDGDRLKLVMIHQGRSSRWLAKHINIDPALLSRAIKGDKEGRPITGIEKVLICNLLGVPMSMIFQDEAS